MNKIAIKIKNNFRLYCYIKNNLIIYMEDYGLMAGILAIPKTAWGNDTPSLYDIECPKDCPFNGKVCDCPGEKCDIDPKNGAYLCGGETVTITAKDPSDIGFIGEWISFLEWSTQPPQKLISDVFVYVYPYIEPNAHYGKCQKEYLMCLAGEMLPFNPFSGSTYVSAALSEISEDFEEKAFDYYYKNFKRLKHPNKSKYIYGPMKISRLLAKASILVNVSWTGAECITKMLSCLYK